MRRRASALVAVLTTMVAQTEVLAGQVEQGFGRHPDAEIYRSQPGLGTILAARVLAEFGDDPDRYTDAKARKNYSGMSPITKASGTKRVVLARYARNRRLGDALFLQAYSALGLTRSPGVLRPPPGPRRHPLPSPPRPRQPARRHPPRLPAHPHALRRTPRLAHRTRPGRRCLNRSLTRRDSSWPANPAGAQPRSTRARTATSIQSLTAASTGTQSNSEEARP